MNPTASCSQYKQDFPFVLSMTYIKVIFDAKSNLCMCDNNAWMANKFFHIIVLESSLHLEIKSQPKNMHNVF